MYQKLFAVVGMLGALGLGASFGCGGTEGPTRYPVSGSNRPWNTSSRLG